MPQLQEPQTRAPHGKHRPAPRGVGTGVAPSPLSAGRSRRAGKVANVGSPGAQSRADAAARSQGRAGISRRDETNGDPRSTPDPPSWAFPQVDKPARRADLAPAPGGSGWLRTRRRCRSQGAQRAPSRPEIPRSPPSDGMEADGDRDELARLRSVFAACDANRSGRLEREEFGALCAELRVRPADAEAVFQRLDADRDGAITFQEFARGFRGASRGGRRRGCAARTPALAEALAGSDPRDGEEDEGDEGDEGNEDAAAALAAPWGPAGPGQAWQDFQERLGDEAKFIPRCVCGGWRARGDGGVSLCRPAGAYSSVSRFSPFADSLTFPRLSSPKS